MAEEQAQVETTTTEETQEQTTTQDTNVSEDAKTQEPSGKGDINEALRQEREARRQLEAKLNDQQFIYEQARKLGLTEEEAQAAVEESQPTQFVGTPKAQPGMTYSDYEYFKSLDQSKEKYPQLATDEADQIAVTALMNAMKLSPLAAAEKYYSKINKVAEEARVEGAREKEATISEKEQAQTVTSTTVTNSENAEYEDILRRSRNQMNPKEAAKAQLELIMWKEKNRK